VNDAARVGSAIAGSERCGVPLAELTRLRLGGSARRLPEAELEDQVVATVAAADAAGEPLLVIAGGSNLVIADAGFDGTALRINTRGVSSRRQDGRVRLTVAAGDGAVGAPAHAPQRSPANAPVPSHSRWSTPMARLTRLWDRAP
jgi:hypothetical protein